MPTSGTRLPCAVASTVRRLAMPTSSRKAIATQAPKASSQDGGAQRSLAMPTPVAMPTTTAP